MNSSCSTWISKLQQQLQHPISFQKTLDRIFSLRDRRLPRVPQEGSGLGAQGNRALLALACQHWSQKLGVTALRKRLLSVRGCSLFQVVWFFFPVTKTFDVLAAKIQSVATLLSRYASTWKYLYFTINESKPTLEWNYCNSIIYCIPWNTSRCKWKRKEIAMQTVTLSIHSKPAPLDLLFPLILISSQRKRLHYIIQCDKGEKMHLWLLKSLQIKYSGP